VVEDLEEALEDVDALLLGEAEGLHGCHRTPRPLMLGARPRRTHPSLFFPSRFDWSGSERLSGRTLLASPLLGFASLA
jgi:hypothetical protein